MTGLYGKPYRLVFYDLLVNGFFIQSLIKVVTYDDSEDRKDYGVDSIVKSIVDNKNLGNGSIL